MLQFLLNLFLKVLLSKVSLQFLHRFERNELQFVYL